MCPVPLHTLPADPYRTIQLLEWLLKCLFHAEDLPNEILGGHDHLLLLVLIVLMVTAAMSGVSVVQRCGGGGAVVGLVVEEEEEAALMITRHRGAR